MANKLALKLNLLTKEEEQRVKNLLEKYNLPTTFKIEDENSFYEHFFLDKKSSNNKIAFILPNGKIGTNIIKNDIDKKIVLDVLKEFKG
jgi:3-dehydroquinate synthase